MVYLIDYDTLKPAGKSDNKSEIEKFLKVNELDRVFAIVSNSEELCLTFTLDELNQIAGSKSDDEETAAIKANAKIEKARIPKLTKAKLKVIAEAENRHEAKRQSEIAKAKIETSTKPKKRATPKPKKATAKPPIIIINW